MSVSLEKIDLIRNRTNISYSTAKKALEKNNDDLVETLIYLEDNDLIIHTDNNKNRKQRSVFISNKIKSFFSSYTTVYNKNNDRIFQCRTWITFTNLLLLIIITLPILIISMLLKHTWKFESLNEINNLNLQNETIKTLS